MKHSALKFKSLLSPVKTLRALGQILFSLIRFHKTERCSCIAKGLQEEWKRERERSCWEMKRSLPVCSLEWWKSRRMKWDMSGLTLNCANHPQEGTDDMAEGAVLSCCGWLVCLAGSAQVINLLQDILNVCPICWKSPGNGKRKIILILWTVDTTSCGMTLWRLTVY